MNFDSLEKNAIECVSSHLLRVPLGGVSPCNSVLLLQCSACFVEHVTDRTHRPPRHLRGELQRTGDCKPLEIKDLMFQAVP